MTPHRYLSFLFFNLILVSSVSAQSLISHSDPHFSKRITESLCTLPVDRFVSSNVARDIGRNEKSDFLAVMYSLILPGMGEWYAGNFSKGKYPFITESVLWLGYTGFNLYGNWTRDDGRTFARQHAGVSLSGKDDGYFVDIGNFMDIYEYNQKKLKDRTLSEVYSEDPTAGYAWKWDSDANRQTFKDSRIFSDELYNGSRFVILALIANRVWSAVQAALLVKSYNQEIQNAQSYLPSFHSNVTLYDGRVDGILFLLSKSF